MEQKNDVSPDTQKELFTTREIAKKYEVSEYTITQTWIPKGLEYFPSKPFKFRIEWVEKYILEQKELAKLKRQPSICEIMKKPKLKPVKKNDNGEMKIRIEDFFPGKERKNA